MSSPPQQSEGIDLYIKLEFLIDAAKVLVEMNDETIRDLRRVCEESRKLRARAHKLVNYHPQEDRQRRDGRCLELSPKLLDNNTLKFDNGSRLNKEPGLVAGRLREA
jgi:hypothetical protein